MAGRYRGLSLIIDYANHVRGRSFRETVRAHCKRWSLIDGLCPAEYNEGKRDADAIVVSRYISDRTSVGWSFPASGEKGSMKPRTVDSTIPLIPRSSRALSST